MMPDCSGCGTGWICRGAHGTYGDTPHEEPFAGDAASDRGEARRVRVRHTVNPRSAPGEPFDEVHGAYKNYYLNSWFESVPGADVPGGGTRLDSVEYAVYHHPDADGSQYRFADPRPDGDGGHENWIANTAISIVAGASSHPLVAVGAAAIEGYLASPFWGGPVDLERTTRGGDRERWWWDIDAVDDVPDGPCRTTGVRFAVEPGVNDLDGARLITTNRYHFYGPRRDPDRRGRAARARQYWLRYLYQTDWIDNTVAFDITR